MRVTTEMPATVGRLDWCFSVARYHLEKDDLESALRFMNLLRGEPLLVAGDWLREVRLHLETVQAARAVLAYAAAAAIESM